jgi:segregation and condensation protein A
MTTPLSSLPPVQVGEFEGPLDLLLDEVRRQNIAIEEIALGPMAERFLSYVRTATECRLNLDIEWIHMAATLIQWKSRSLLPRDPAVEEKTADPLRDELVRQLVAHRHQAAEQLGQRQSLEQTRFPRGEAGAGDAGAEEGAEPGFVSVWDLVQQARELARWAAEHRGQRRAGHVPIEVEPDPVTASEMIDFLRDTLARVGEVPVDALRLLYAEPSAGRRCCLFLALLELAQIGELQIEQAEPLGQVHLIAIKTAISAGQP